MGIQRTLDEKRVKEIKSYVRTEDASFPTSVILALESADVAYDEKNGIMRIRKDQDVARIIDGQHRIAGLVNYEGPQFQLNVTIALDLDLEDQAHMFATINLTHTKVNRSLNYDLYEFAIKRSPQKTCHNTAKLLNTREGSPFHHRIKVLGKATGLGKEYITQAAVVERVIVHISANAIQAMEDRDILRRGQTTLSRATEEQERRGLFFRNMFIDERDEDILLVVWNFFTAVATKWPISWNSAQEGAVLNRSLGFAALTRVMSKVVISIDHFDIPPTIAEFTNYLDRTDFIDGSFTRATYRPGSGGEAALYNEFMTQMGINA